MKKKQAKTNENEGTLKVKQETKKRMNEYRTRISECWKKEKTNEWVFDGNKWTLKEFQRK